MAEECTNGWQGWTTDGLGRGSVSHPLSSPAIRWPVARASPLLTEACEWYDRWHNMDSGARGQTVAVPHPVEARSDEHV